MYSISELPAELLDDLVTRSFGQFFKTMFGEGMAVVAPGDLDPPGGDAAATAAPASATHLQIASAVGFTGDVRAMLFVTLTEGSARELACRCLDLGALELAREGDHDTVDDFMGELTNMAAGTLRNLFSELGITCRLTHPQIARREPCVPAVAVAGDPHCSRRSILLQACGHRLVVEFVVHPSSGAPPAPAAAAAAGAGAGS